MLYSYGLEGDLIESDVIRCLTNTHAPECAFPKGWKHLVLSINEVHHCFRVVTILQLYQGFHLRGGAGGTQ